MLIPPRFFLKDIIDPLIWSRNSHETPSVQLIIRIRVPTSKMETIESIFHYDHLIQGNVYYQFQEVDF